jgi:transposase-like protein
VYSENNTSLFEKMPSKFISESAPILSTLEWLCMKIMEVEVNYKVGALKSQRKYERKVYRSGYRPRRFDTRIGTLNLMIPKLRKGGYIPFFVNDEEKAEIVLLNIIQEAYTDDISVSKIGKATKILGIDFISDDQISQITSGLKKQVNEFKNMP